MNLNLVEELDITGHLSISKVFKDGKEELVFDDHNIITNGMGFTLAKLFSGSGSPSILDYQIDRFQVGTSATITGGSAETSSNFFLWYQMYSQEDFGVNTNVQIVSGYLSDGAGDPLLGPGYEQIFGLIPQQNITKIDSNTIRYTIVLDENTCNDLTARRAFFGPSGDGGDITKIGLFAKNPDNHPLGVSTLVAYREFPKIRKTSDFSLVFRWSINF
jgi:hypothetical protein